MTTSNFSIDGFCRVEGWQELTRRRVAGGITSVSCAVLWSADGALSGRLVRSCWTARV